MNFKRLFCVFCALLLGLLTLPMAGCGRAGADAARQDLSVPGAAGAGAAGESAPASAKGEQEEYWLGQAELLAARLVERCFSPNELTAGREGLGREELDPVVIMRFICSLAFDWQNAAKEQYVQAAAPERTADGTECRMPLDRVARVAERCFGLPEEDFRALCAEQEPSGYDPDAGFWTEPLEVGRYGYFTAETSSAAFVSEDAIEVRLSLWGNLSYDAPTWHGECTLTLLRMRQDGEEFLRFERFDAGKAVAETVELYWIEQFLNESQLLHWLSGVSPEALSGGPEDAFGSVYLAISEVLRRAAAQNGRPAQQNENGVPYFPLEDYETAARELFGQAWELEGFAQRRAAREPAPEGMLCTEWGYDGADGISRIVLCQDTLRREKEGFSIRVQDYFTPVGRDTEILSAEYELLFMPNAAYEFSPLRLLAVHKAEA